LKPNVVPWSRQRLLSNSSSCLHRAECAAGARDQSRVPLTAERVQVDKKPVVNEEIRVGKRQVQESKRVSGEVRHEELRTETEGE